MGYESGQKCYVSGVYKCTNCGKTIPLSKGETFTPCSCGDANWVLDRKASTPAVRPYRKRHRRVA
jgi:hypothetical protein